MCPSEAQGRCWGRAGRRRACSRCVLPVLFSPVTHPPPPTSAVARGGPTTRDRLRSVARAVFGWRPRVVRVLRRARRARADPYLTRSHPLTASCVVASVRFRRSPPTPPRPSLVLTSPRTVSGVAAGRDCDRRRGGGAADERGGVGPAAGAPAPFLSPSLPTPHHPLPAVARGGLRTGRDRRCAVIRNALGRRPRVVRVSRRARRARADPYLTRSHPLTASCVVASVRFSRLAPTSPRTSLTLTPCALSGGFAGHDGDRRGRGGAHVGWAGVGRTAGASAPFCSPP